MAFLFPHHTSTPSIRCPSAPISTRRAISQSWPILPTFRVPITCAVPYGLNVGVFISDKDAENEGSSDGAVLQFRVRWVSYPWGQEKAE